MRLLKGVISMKIILSIKPKYVEAIKSGEKKFEYRRKIFKKKNIEKVLIYSSSPVCRIVGEFSIEYIISDTPDNIWSITKCFSGIDYDRYRKYFCGLCSGYAIKITNLIIYDEAIKLEDAYPDIKPPQSYRYV
jgi:predicted transcriptional regulator